MLCGHIHRWIGFCLSRHLINKHHLGTTIGRAGEQMGRESSPERSTQRMTRTRHPRASPAPRRSRREPELEENPNSKRTRTPSRTRRVWLRRGDLLLRSGCPSQISATQSPMKSPTILTAEPPQWSDRSSHSHKSPAASSRPHTNYTMARDANVLARRRLRPETVGEGKRHLLDTPLCQHSVNRASARRALARERLAWAAARSESVRS